MKRRLLLLADALLLVVAAFLGVRLYEAWTARAPAPPAEPSSSASAEVAAPPAAVAPGPPLTAFNVVAERNLFSPTRSETAPEPPRQRRAHSGRAARAEAAPLRRRDSRRGPRPRVSRGRAAAQGVLVLRRGSRRRRASRADQGRSGRAAPRRRDLRGAPQRPRKTSSTHASVRRTIVAKLGERGPADADEASGAGASHRRDPVPRTAEGAHAGSRAAAELGRTRITA